MTHATSTSDLKSRLETQLTMYRTRTKEMIAPLTDDDLHKQQNDIMSPLVWDVGHVGNFEELWLLRELDGRAPHDAQFDDMYNPFDNPRWCRGDLPLLDRAEAVDYMNEVRSDSLAILQRSEFDPESPLLGDGYVFRMVIQHEAQHQETMSQALDMRTDLGPYSLAAFPRVDGSRAVDDTERVHIPGGAFLLGTNDRSDAYDNERPQHAVDVGEFWIDRFPTTNRRFATFVDAGGYDNPEWWSEDGWEWRQSVDEDAPQGWTPKLGGGWLVTRFGHVLDLEPAEPVQHITFHEAEAFASYVGGRLPTEEEWEKAASWGPDARRAFRYPWGDQFYSAYANVGGRRWGPMSVGALPQGASRYGVEQLLGDVYEWTTSAFEGYPGFAAFPYPEYSEVFFNDPEYRVLRGASWATSSSVARTTFRNWDYRIRRQIFSGVRLAWDRAE
ncbi:MAG: ergothioneine biosynthesis protein EgtB [Acidimicrobiia bacterium]